MNVLIVNKYLYIKGGSETYCFELADFLKEKGHNVAFFGMKSEKDIVKETFDMVDNIDMGEMGIKKIFYPFRVIYSFEARKKIRKAIKMFKPDVVHINNYNYQLTPSILYEIKKHNIPIVQTVHDSNIVCPNHRLCNLYKGEACIKCKNGRYINCFRTKCMDNSYIKSAIGMIEATIYKILKTYKKKIDKFIFPSAFIEEALSGMGFKTDKGLVLHNFIKNAHTDNVQKKNYVIYFGRLSKEKGIEMLLDVVGKTPEIQYVFAGTGPYEEELVKYKNIDYRGFLSGEELKKTIREALFSIVPAIWFENCPMNLLESYNMGTPVIGSELGGVKELIKDGKTGLLFRNEDEVHLLERVRFLYKSTELVEEYSKNCLEYVKNFDIQRYYDVLIKIYTEVIEKGNKIL